MSASNAGLLETSNAVALSKGQIYILPVLAPNVSYDHSGWSDHGLQSPPFIAKSTVIHVIRLQSSVFCTSLVHQPLSLYQTTLRIIIHVGTYDLSDGVDIFSPAIPKGCCYFYRNLLDQILVLLETLFKC